MWKEKEKNGAIFRLYYGADNTIVFLSPPFLDGGSKIYIRNIHAAKNQSSFFLLDREEGDLFPKFLQLHYQDGK